MFFLQYTPHLIACILPVTGVLSASQLQDSANPGMGLSQEGDLNTLSLNQGDLIASQPDSNTPSDQLFNEIKNKPQTGTLSSNIGQQNSFSNPAIEQKIIPPSQDSALVPFDENGGLTNVIPSFPSLPQLNIFPQGSKADPKIPPDTQTDSPTERKEPNCKDDKFAFCCQKGPPVRGPNKTGIDSPEVLLERKRERKSRLRNCRKCEIRLSTFITLVSVIVLLVVCFLNEKNLIRYSGRGGRGFKGSKDDPACSIPENEACCTCISKRQSAFFCYNPNGITSPPRPIRPLPPDPNPSEPDTSGATEQKRDLIENNSEDLFAAAKPDIPDWKRPGGPARFDWTCSDEFLKYLGLGSGRSPPVFTPENPFRRRPGKKRPGTEGGWDD